LRDNVSIPDKNKLEAGFKKKYVTDCEECFKATPKDIRANAIEEYFTGVCNAYNRYNQKTESENWKRANLKGYKHKEIKSPIMKFQRKREQQSISIPSKNSAPKELITKLGSKYPQLAVKLYPRFLKEPIALDRRVRKNKTLRHILDSGIQYDYKLLKTKSGRYYFCLPYAASVIPNNSIKQAACDSGVRNFQTVYSPQGELEQYGHDGDKTIRAYQSIISTLKYQYFKGDLKYNERLRMLRLRLQEKLRNMVNDLHLKTADSLCDKYGTIILPWYGVASMIRCGKISPYTKRETLALAHAEFRRRLISKAELRACTVLIPKNEYKTTMTCGICFEENRNVGESKVYSCPECGLIAGRDVNAPRNIFIRQLIS
jgi:transposase